MLRGDGQAEAAAAAGARWIELAEALEDALEPVGRHARPAICDGDDDVVVAPLGTDRDLGGRRMLTRVVEQVAHDALEAPRIRFDDERRFG